MTISAKIVLDSVNSATGDRLTTFVICVPKFLVAQLNTHRSLSKNCASSRACPAKKIRQKVLENPVIPVYFGANQKGMQACSELTGVRKWLALQLWLKARYGAIAFHYVLEKIGLHKELTNRLLESWLYVEVIITGTEWRNFFLLRNHPDAQPEFGELARLMQEAYNGNKPNLLAPGEWHLPFVLEQEMGLEITALKKHSTARCGRVSYFLPSGTVSTLEEDEQFVHRLSGSVPKHLSPFEHQSMALETSERVGNLVGWKMQRKDFEGESGGDYEKQLTCVN